MQWLSAPNCPWCWHWSSSGIKHYITSKFKWKSFVSVIIEPCSCSQLHLFHHSQSQTAHPVLFFSRHITEEHQHPANTGKFQIPLSIILIKSIISKNTVTLRVLCKGNTPACGFRKAQASLIVWPNYLTDIQKTASSVDKLRMWEHKQHQLQTIIY